MPRNPDFYSQMSRDELNKLEAFAREPKATVDRVHEYLLAQGFTASRSAAGRWFKTFRETDALSEAAAFADAINTANGELGGVDFTKAAHLQLSQRLTNRLARDLAADDDSADLKYMIKSAAVLERLARVGRHATKNEMELIELREMQTSGSQEMEKLAEQAARGEITREKILAARERVFGKRVSA